MLSPKNLRPNKVWAKILFSKQFWSEGGIERGGVKEGGSQAGFGGGRVYRGKGERE